MTRVEMSSSGTTSGGKQDKRNWKLHVGKKRKICLASCLSGILRLIRSVREKKKRKLRLAFHGKSTSPQRAKRSSPESVETYSLSSDEQVMVITFEKHLSEPVTRRIFWSSTRTSRICVVQSPGNPGSFQLFLAAASSGQIRFSGEHPVIILHGSSWLSWQSGCLSPAVQARPH